MTPEKDSQLCEKYPKIFGDRYASPGESSMCWGFQCGDGWHDLIDCLCSCIQHHVDWKLKGQEQQVAAGRLPPEDSLSEEQLQVVADQVKEKFGGLRFYYTGGDDEIRGMVRLAESLSFKTCEDCGAPGELRKTRHWWRTLCGPCDESWEVRRTARWTEESSR